MEPATVAWGWPLGVLAAGLLIGAFFVWRMRRAPAGAATTAAVPLPLRDLDGQLDALVVQLRELQDLAAKRSPEQLARERYALEVQAAEALRQRERGAAAIAPKKGKAAVPPPGENVPTGFLASRPAFRGFLLGTATATAVALLVVFVARTARPREEGGSLTGNLPSPPPGPAITGEGGVEAELKAALEKDPDDLVARMDMAQLRLSQRDLMAVWNETQYVLAKQPGHPQAMAYQALVRLAMGQPSVAIAMLKEALSKDPNLFEGYLHLALAETRAGNPKAAQAAIDEASRRYPDRAEALTRALTEIRASGTQQQPAGTEEDPHARVALPGSSSETAAAPSAEGGGLAGVIELPAAAASKLGPRAVVFVTVREAGAADGPPAAAKRLPASSFPLAFAIGPGDSMMGQPIPARASLEARVDSDGDPLTRDPKDPSAKLDGVAAGSSRLRLVLR